MCGLAYMARAGQAHTIRGSSSSLLLGLISREYLSCNENNMLLTLMGWYPTQWYLYCNSRELFEPEVSYNANKCIVNLTYLLKHSIFYNKSLYT